MFCPYPDYRRTDLKWFEHLPDSWGILRTKQMFRLAIEKAQVNNQMELLSVYTHIGVRPRKSLEQRGNKASTTDGYWVVKEGDIICNKLLAWMGAIGVSHYKGVTSPAYDILRPIKPCNTDYYHFLFRTKKYLQQFKIRSRGIMDMRLRLYFDQFGQIPIPVPPRPEQDQIVTYLRVQDAHIARFIQAKRDLIKLLTEQKLRIIDHAITRGLDASVALKPSGIEWLGEMPEHWKALKLKFATKRIVGGSTPKSDEASYWDGGIVWVTPRDISKTDSLHTSLRTISAAGLQSCASTLVPPGSIVITSRAPVGNVAIARVELCTNQGCKAVVPAPDIAISDFLFLLLLRMKERLQVLANGTTFAEIGTWVLANEFIPVPPVSEQQAICRWITEECQPLDDAIARTEEEIKLIREYRDRLIADVVTGQVDVRGWQPGPDDVVDDAALAALGDENEEVTEEEDDDGED
ncbi:restriction endonuclease subunit S [Eikenella corrodens]|uniref:restriction endonuclease subunit S n=1 Tax=Eikenella corrodens TaxID=539 RepID=UPI0007D04F73|nr:restriction endonuclease subunit S [Eikenella corrodens]OAM32406.1 restriction endonuclease subunit S [Eikenella corrodens]